MTRTDKADDDLLREAADPATPGERLRVLWHETLDRLDRSFSHADRLALFAIMCNPSLPLDLLRDVLRMGGDAWYNPSLPALLRSEPGDEFRGLALRLLATMGTQENCIAPDQPRLAAMRAALAQDLAAAVAVWSSVPAYKAPKTWEFARLLATLFHLPWPADPDVPVTPHTALLPHVEGLPEFLESAGYRVRLVVQRADDQPLTDDDRRALALAAESYQAGGSERSDDELAGVARAVGRAAGEVAARR